MSTFETFQAFAKKAQEEAASEVLVDLCIELAGEPPGEGSAAELARDKRRYPVARAALGVGDGETLLAAIARVVREFGEARAALETERSQRGEKHGLRFALEQEKAARHAAEQKLAAPVPMILSCPTCRTRHIDEGEFATKPHHTHACQGCGMVWRPAIGLTVGVQFLPGFKNEVASW